MVKKLENEIKKADDLFLRIDHWAQTPVLFLMRLLWGVLFIMEGWYKLTNIESNVSYYASLHIPYPEFMVYLSGSAEFFGGILLIVGFMTRIAAIPLIITMIVAIISDPSHSHFMGHGSGQTETFISQIPLVFLYACLVIMLFGPGKWSLDYRLKDKFFLSR